MLKILKDYVGSPEDIKVTMIRPFQYFFRKEASSSIVLAAATVIAFLWANSPFAASYHAFWETELILTLGDYSIHKTLHGWISEGLMTIFFFIVGIEIKREILVGELASAKKAVLPAGAALGGMVFPALVYVAFNYGRPTISGWGIPMATDIAFSLGAIFILGKRLPQSLRVFLSAFAIADDLGAVLVIALFYTKEIVPAYLFIASAVIALLVLANIFWVRRTLVYAVLGIALWLAFLGSGLHATVAGVIVAMTIPARGKYDTDKFLQRVSKFMGHFECPTEGCGYSILLNEKHLNAVQSIELACHDVETPLQRLEHGLQSWVAFLVVPLFALANAGLTVGSLDIRRAVTDPVALGIVCGLVFGKPVGITLFSYLLVRTKIAAFPAGVNLSLLCGVGMLGGIGFTMSLFISSLSFADATLLDFAKVGVLLGSAISGVAGLVFLRAASANRRA